MATNAFKSIFDPIRNTWKDILIARKLAKLRDRFLPFYKEGHKMALLPDKNPAQSATIWGNAIKALGAVLAVVGAVFVKEASWGDVLKTLMEYGGVLMALVGWIIASIGQRKAIGASIVASQEALAATNKVLDNQADVKIALGKKK
jgi:hypothetical protein